MKFIGLIYKQLSKELLKNEIFIVLLFTLTCFTSFTYFFIHFSSDANLMTLNQLSSLTENQILYQTALLSNTSLARSFLLTFTLLTGVVFAIFYYRFFNQNAKQIGILKALGFKDSILCVAFIGFTILLTLIGGLLAIGGSYFASEMLLSAHMPSYNVMQLNKNISLSTIFWGLGLPIIIFSLITLIIYLSVGKQEIGLLLSSRNEACKYPHILSFANKVSRPFPASYRPSIRLVLRKPTTLIFILIAVMTFSIMLLLSYSLNLSNSKIYHSQTLGYYYNYDVTFDTPLLSKDTRSLGTPYLMTTGEIELPNTTLKQNMISFEAPNTLFELMDVKHHVLQPPSPNTVFISPALQELYQLEIGDAIQLKVGKTTKSFLISQIAINAQLDTVYLSSTDLEDLLKLPTGAYNGLWTTQNYFGKDFIGVTTTSNIDRLIALSKGMTSNHLGVRMNQLIGIIASVILLSTALLIIFQYHTRDILILHLMGYKPTQIHTLLINIYHPTLCFFFILTLYPSIQITKNILHSLSLKIGDYLPFTVNLPILICLFVLLNIIYFLVQLTFTIGIKKLIHSDTIYEYTNSH